MIIMQPRHLLLFLGALLFVRCADLDIRPNSDIILPKSATDFVQLLNHESVTSTSALPHLHGGEFVTPDLAAWQIWNTFTQRNAYTYATDLYEGEENIPDWNVPYRGIFYCNNVLDNLDVLTDQGEHDRLKGWALFARAYLLHDLLVNFAPHYDPATAETALGIPLKLTAGIDNIQPRASVQACYDRIIGDMRQAASLLDQVAPSGNRNRPSKAAVAAFLARLYLHIGDYRQAEEQATQALALFDTLTDFNTLDTLSLNPFAYSTPETIYFSRQVYGYVSYGTGAYYEVDPELYGRYERSDLRSLLYFRWKPNGQLGIKPINTFAGQPFTGLAVDEVYLIKAECLARKGDGNGAMALTNTLLASRYKRDAFTPLKAPDADAALATVLLERRRALLYRCQRWQDVKRLNREGYGITLSRELGGETYTLSPNDPRYVFPIPPSEIVRSGIQQNER